MNIFAVWLTDVIFLQDCGMYFMLSHKLVSSCCPPRLSENDTICLHFHFSVSRPGVGGISFPSISFCLYVVALSVYRASNVWDRVQE